MASREINDYYDNTSAREIRADLKLAVSLIEDPQIAIDCGCGAGADIAYLRQSGFVVHAFDSETASIERCRSRFDGDDGVYLTTARFEEFEYPSASLISADASLFYCAPDDFPSIWQKMTTALGDNGVFCGSFLGAEDTTAGPDYNRDAFWPDVMVMDETSLNATFAEFEILKWTEHNTIGETADGTPHHWHIFAIVARKRLL